MGYLVLLSPIGILDICHIFGIVATGVGTTLLHSTSFHPMKDGQTERVNQILEDMMRVVAMEWQGSWDEHLDLGGILL